MQLHTPIGKIDIELPEEDRSIRPLIRNNMYEYSEQVIMQKYITPSDICVDAGANFGIHTVVMSKLADRVIAIEADPSNIPVLESNLQANHCDNVTLIHKAVFDKKGAMQISSARGNTACSYLHTGRFSQDDEIQHTVETDLLVNIIDNQPVDFLKMDIEGSELAAMDSSNDWFVAQKPKLLIEINRWTCTNMMGFEVTKLINKIYEIGYNKLTLLGREEYPISFQQLREISMSAPQTVLNVLCIAE